MLDPLKSDRSLIKARKPACRRPMHLLTLLAVFLVILSPLVACKQSSEIEFPTLGTSETTKTGNNQGSETSPTNSDIPQTLTVAMPIGQDALNALRLLFLAKRSGLISQEPGQYIGQEIQLADLQQFDSPLTINLEPVSVSTGATKEQIAVWRAASAMPDIIYSLDAATTIGLDQAANLNELLVDNSLLSATHLYPSILESSRQGLVLSGIPYLASVPLIYINQTLLNQFQMDPPSLNWTWQAWYDYSVQLQDKINISGYGATPEILGNLSDDPASLSSQLQKSIYVSENSADLLAFLPASLKLSAGWAMWDGQNFRFDDLSFQKAYLWLNQYTQQGLTPLHLDLIQKQTAFSSQNARQSGRIAMWSGDSADLAYWHQQNAFQVTESFIPCSPVEMTGTNQDSSTAPQSAESLLSMRNPVEIRSLLISKTCPEISLAAELAAFIALDADSLLLQSRYQLFEGFIPLIDDQIVWDALVDRQLYGRRLKAIKAKLPYAYCSGQFLTFQWEKIIKKTIGDFGQPLMTTADLSAQSAVWEHLIQIAREAP